MGDWLLLDSADARSKFCCLSPIDALHARIGNANFMAANEDLRTQVELLLSKGKLAMAARLCRKHQIDISSFDELESLIKRLYQSGHFHEILVARREIGDVGPYTTGDLLRKLAQTGNDSAYLKHAGQSPDDETRKEALVTLHRRVEFLLRKGALVKAARACRKRGVPPDTFREIDAATENLYKKHQYQVILGAFYEAGVFGSHTVKELLSKLASTEMHAAFLVNAYRFGIRSGFEEEIARSIQWHRDRGLKDAEAWEHKFAQMEDLPVKPTPSEKAQPTSVIRLRPIQLKSKVASSEKSDAKNETILDPYIVSQVSRVKVEQATSEHQRTLSALESCLEVLSYRLLNSNLIDLLGEAGDWTGIFEVKSITQDNERDQVRHAVSQLFEYRFLHQLPHANLFVVFSKEPFSGWLVDYLRDLGFGVLWLEDQELAGPSLTDIMSAAGHASCG